MRRGTVFFGPMALTAGLAILVMLAHVLSAPTDSMLAENLQNSLHGPGFAILATAALAIFRKTNTNYRAYFSAATLCAVLGASGELLQLFVARDASLADLLNDAVGAAGALSLAAAFDPTIRFRKNFTLRATIVVFAMLMLFAGLSPFLWYSYASLQRYHAMPTILSFEHLWENAIYQTYGDARLSVSSEMSNWPAPGRQLGRIVSGKASFSGLRIDPSSDWSSYSALTFWAGTTNNRTDRWTIRISDLGHNNKFNDRFNRVIEIGSEPVKYRVPLKSVRSAPSSRDMDMRNIASIELFHQSTDDTSIIVVDDFRLEK